MKEYKSLNTKHTVQYWLSEYDWKGSLAVTAHYSDRFLHYFNNQNKERLWFAAITINTKFLNKLNKRVFGNASKRFGKKVECLIVIEQEASKTHMHAMIKIPSHKTAIDFEENIQDAWMKTLNTNRDIKISLNDNRTFRQNFGGYITKEVKPNNTDCIDWSNSILPADQPSL